MYYFCNYSFSWTIDHIANPKNDALWERLECTFDALWPFVGKKRATFAPYPSHNASFWR